MNGRDPILLRIEAKLDHLIALKTSRIEEKLDLLLADILDKDKLAELTAEIEKSTEDLTKAIDANAAQVP